MRKPPFTEGSTEQGLTHAASFNLGDSQKLIRTGRRGRDSPRVAELTNRRAGIHTQAVQSQTISGFSSCTKLLPKHILHGMRTLSLEQQEKMFKTHCSKKRGGQNSVVRYYTPLGQVRKGKEYIIIFTLKKHCLRILAKVGRGVIARMGAEWRY